MSPACTCKGTGDLDVCSISCLLSTGLGVRAGHVCKRCGFLPGIEGAGLQEQTAALLGSALILQPLKVLAPMQPRFS